MYEGRIVKLSLDTVGFPDGSTGVLEMIRHQGAAAVLPVLGALDDPDPEILLIRQYRYAADGFIYEVPAGVRDEQDRDWVACAERELEEETGFRAGRMVPLTRILTTPGFTDEVIHLFVATQLEGGETSRDDDEFIEVVPMPLSRAVEMVRDGRIVDGKSVCTILYVSSFLAQEGGSGPRESEWSVS